MYIVIYGYMSIVEGVCWFTASPGLSQTDWTLAGWGCTPVVHESNHGTQDKPAINTHSVSQYQVRQVWTCVLGSLDLVSSTREYKLQRTGGRSTVILLLEQQRT